MNQFYVLRPVDEKSAWTNLDTAINYMTKIVPDKQQRPEYYFQTFGLLLSKERL